MPLRNAEKGLVIRNINGRYWGGSKWCNALCKLVYRDEGTLPLKLTDTLALHYVVNGSCDHIESSLYYLDHNYGIVAQVEVAP